MTILFGMCTFAVGLIAGYICRGFLHDEVSSMIKKITKKFENK
jgi:hypothetical protein